MRPNIEQDALHVSTAISVDFENGLRVFREFYDKISQRGAYDGVGMVYPQLGPQYRARVIGAMLGIMDHKRYDITQREDVEKIREPLLFADVCIARPLYWPGIDEGKDLAERFKTFEELRTELIDDSGMFKHDKVLSDFTYALNILRSDRSKFGEDYVKYLQTVNPKFLDRVLEGMVSVRFYVHRFSVEEGTKRLKELLPELLHNRIEPIRASLDRSYLKPLQH